MQRNSIDAVLAAIDRALELAQAKSIEGEESN
jgi:hypothetical protein